jgi:hypothetical protein
MIHNMDPLAILIAAEEGDEDALYDNEDSQSEESLHWDSGLEVSETPDEDAVSVLRAKPGPTPEQLARWYGPKEK